MRLEREMRAKVDLGVGVAGKGDVGGAGAQLQQARQHALRQVYGI